MNIKDMDKLCRDFIAPGIAAKVKQLAEVEFQSWLHGFRERARNLVMKAAEESSGEIAAMFHPDKGPIEIIIRDERKEPK